VQVLGEDQNSICSGIQQTGYPATVIFHLGVQLRVLNSDSRLVGKTGQQVAVIRRKSGVLTKNKDHSENALTSDKRQTHTAQAAHRDRLGVTSQKTVDLLQF